MRTETGAPVLSPGRALTRTTPADVIGSSDHDARLAAAQAAGVHGFVTELPEGYYTPVGEGGVVLTASQRLRLVIARLIVEGSSSIVLDDPTAGLDGTGEAAVLPGLAALMRDREVTVTTASPAVHAIVARAAGGPSNGSLPQVPVPIDPALPSMPRLLDANEMAPLLGSLLEQHEADVRVQSVRYKPADNIVIGYSVLTASGWRTAVAYSRAGSTLKLKRKMPVNKKLARRVADQVPARRPFARLPEVAALVQWMPLDVRLPVLADDAQRLAARLGKKGIATDAGAEPELLRYWPRRRAVVRFGSYVLKLYRDRADYDQARRALRASATLSRVRTPAYVGALKARQTTVQEWLPGHSPSLWPDSSEAAGALLADLHGDSLLALAPMSPEHVLGKAAGRAGFVAHLLPRLQPKTSALLSELEAKTPHGLLTVTSHGNFHAGQLLSGPSGLAMLDVDRMCLAMPAYDLASFAAHLAFGRPGDLEVVCTAVDSLVAGYGSRPGDLAWYLSACLLRRAAVPFRFQDERWPEAMTELVSLAREVLR